MLKLFPSGAARAQPAERDAAPGFEENLTEATRLSAPAAKSQTAEDRPANHSQGTSQKTSDHQRQDVAPAEETTGEETPQANADSEQEVANATEDAIANVFVAFIQSDQPVETNFHVELEPTSTVEVVEAQVHVTAVEANPPGEAASSAAATEGPPEEELGGATTQAYIAAVAVEQTDLTETEPRESQQLAPTAANDQESAKELAPPRSEIAAAVSIESAPQPVTQPAGTSSALEQPAEGYTATHAIEQPLSEAPAVTAEDDSSGRKRQSSGSTNETIIDEEGQIESSSHKPEHPTPRDRARTISPAASQDLSQSPNDEQSSRGPTQSSERSDSLGPLERLAAGRLQTARSEDPDANQGPRVDAARFVSRVSRAVQTAQNQGGEVRLRLSPPELGSLQIKLTFSEGAMTATLETETTAAKNVLLDNLPALRDRLAEQEIRIEKFDVDVRQEGRGGDAQNWRSGEREENTDNSPRHQRKPAEPAAAEADSAAQPAGPTSLNDGTTPADAINLII